VVAATIRDYRADDEEPVVALALRAWAPVFASLGQVLGRELATRLHGDWRRYQDQAVRAVLSDPAGQAWVAEAGGQPAGFAVATLHRDRLIGEIVMLAVDPAAQGRGTGTALTRAATAWLRERGMRVAMVETGGDPGHAAARRVYEKAAYTPLPVVRYFRTL
jgi:GNAT superfamily N-acetyltransferase